jgi:AcrR family transcriptional regulator
MPDTALARRRPRADSPVIGTRERLILEAEKLFGERGIDGVTMRMVCEAAEQKFAGSVQYHFGDAAGLLYAVFDYREEQLQPARRALLETGRKQGRLDDVRYLLRILFEPNFRMYADQGLVSYIRCHAAYLVTHRPRGVEHPVDRGSDSTQVMRETMALLQQRLAALDAGRATLRLEIVGGMFLHGITEYAADPSRPGLDAQEFYEGLLDMMTAAICVLPRPKAAG